MSHRSHCMSILVDLDNFCHCGTSVSPVSHYISMQCRSRHFISSGFPVIRRSHCPHQDQSISRRFMSPRSPGSHFMSKSCTSSRSMHYVSPLSPRSHQASTPFTFSYFGRSGSLWAIDATIWTTSISIHFQILFVPNEPWEPLFISVMYF